MAADLTQTFIGKHVEKLILGAAAAVFVTAIVWFVAMREPQGRVRDEVNKIVEKIKVDTKAPSIDKALTQEERVTLGVDDPVETAEVFAKTLNGLAGPWEAIVKVVPLRPTHEAPRPPDEKVTPPELIMPVEDVVVAVGRGVTTGQPSNPLAKLVAEKEKPLADVAWAVCIGRVDLTAQRDLFLAGKAEPQKIIVSAVKLERREIAEDGTAGEWKPITPAADPAVMSKIPGRPTNGQDKGSVGLWYLGLDKNQAEVLRAPFYPLVATDPEGQTGADVTGPLTGAVQPPLEPQKGPPPKVEAKPAAEGETKVETPEEAAPPPPPRKPSGSGTPDWLQQSVTTPKTTVGPQATASEAEHVYTTVWAYDDSVVPGKTYQYRMRVAVFNPVYSRLAVEDEKARWAIDFESEWSEPTDEVAVPPIVDFFFVGTFGERVNLELHRWIMGQWVIVPSAPSNLGAPVLYTRAGLKIIHPGSGKETTLDVDLSPQVLIVDVIKNFPYQPAGGNRPIPTNVLVFADLQSNLLQRVEWEDREEAAKARQIRKDVQPVVAKPTGRPKPPPKSAKTTKTTKSTKAPVKKPPAKKPAKTPSRGTTSR
ncbi:MAG: hypothetical protein IMZ55_16835 [Acidobacteria bacterium]|nr:hypothetical protein [Planctomycetota bacterium]MBE3135134.1 hypothetical protein [Acidobacteriota bacterium]